MLNFLASSNSTLGTHLVASRSCARVLLAPPVGQLFFRVCWPVHAHGPHPQPARVGLKPQFVSADLSRSGLRFQTPAKPKDSLRGSVHHPPITLITRS